MKKIILLATLVLAACASPVQQVLPTATVSIQTMVNNAHTGDKIIVQSGTYSEKVVVNTASIRLECAAPRTCITKGFSLYGDGDQLVGFKIVGAIQEGVYLLGNNQLLEGNEITGTIFGPTGSGSADADCVRLFGSGHVIRNNYCHDFDTQDPNLLAHADCFQTWSGQANNPNALNNSLLEGNYCYQPSNNTSGSSSGFQLSGNTHDLIIRNNIVYTWAAIQGYLDVGGSPYNLTITHNVFAGELGVSYNGTSITSADNVVFSNNIILDQTRKTFNISGTNISAFNNLAWNSDGSMPPTPTTAPSLNSLWGVNPMLDNTYHPAINSPVCLINDYIGAYPCGALPTTLTVTPTVTKTATQTPSPTFTPSQTPTVSPTSTFSPSVTPVPPTQTPTPTPAPAVQCVRVTYKNKKPAGTGLNLREGPSLFNLGGGGYLSYGNTFVPLSIVDNSEGRFAKVFKGYPNDWWIVISLQDGRVFATELACP